MALDDNDFLAEALDDTEASPFAEFEAPSAPRQSFDRVAYPDVPVYMPKPPRPRPAPQYVQAANPQFENKLAWQQANMESTATLAKQYRPQRPQRFDPFDDPLYKQAKYERARLDQELAIHKRLLADFNDLDGKLLEPEIDPATNRKTERDALMTKIENLRYKEAEAGRLGGGGAGRVTQEMMDLAARRKGLFERRQRYEEQVQKIQQARNEFEERVFVPIFNRVNSMRVQRQAAEQPMPVQAPVYDYLAPEGDDPIAQRIRAVNLQRQQTGEAPIKPGTMGGPDLQWKPLASAEPAPQEALPEAPQVQATIAPSVTPNELIRMRKQRQDLETTLAESGDNLDPQVQEGMRKRVSELNERFTSGFAALNPAFQKRISDMTRDPTLLESVGGGVANVAAATGKTMVDTAESVARNAMRLIGRGSDDPAQTKLAEFAGAMREQADGWKDWMPEEVRKKVDESFVSGDIAQGLGSSLAFIAPTGIVGGLGRVVGLGERALANLVTASVATTGAFGEANAFRREAEDKLKPQLESGTITPGEYYRALGMAEMFGGVMGATEAIPLSTFAKRISDLPTGRSFLSGMMEVAGRDGATGVRKWLAGSGGKMLGNVVAEGGEELAQEYGQQAAENLYASQTFDPGREIVNEGVLRGAAAGGVSGAVFSTLTQLIGRKRGGGRPGAANETQEPPPPPPPAGTTPQTQPPAAAQPPPAAQPPAAPSPVNAPAGAPPIDPDLAETLGLNETEETQPPVANEAESPNQVAPGREDAAPDAGAASARPGAEPLPVPAAEPADVGSADAYRAPADVLPEPSAPEPVTPGEIPQAPVSQQPQVEGAATPETPAAPAPVEEIFAGEEPEVVFRDVDPDGKPIEFRIAPSKLNTENARELLTKTQERLQKHSSILEQLRKCLES